LDDLAQVDSLMWCNFMPKTQGTSGNYEEMVLRL